VTVVACNLVVVITVGVRAVVVTVVGCRDVKVVVIVVGLRVVVVTVEGWSVVVVIVVGAKLMLVDVTVVGTKVVVVFVVGLSVVVPTVTGTRILVVIVVGIKDVVVYVIVLVSNTTTTEVSGNGKYFEVNFQQINILFGTHMLMDYELVTFLQRPTVLRSSNLILQCSAFSDDGQPRPQIGDSVGAFECVIGSKCSCHLFGCPG
jgi:hypothetical protein